MLAVPTLPRPLATLLDQRLTRLEVVCREAGVPFYDDAGVDEHLLRVLLASDFAYESVLRDPVLLGPDLVRLMGDPRHADARAGVLAVAADEASLRAELRRFRRREALRLIWRDVNALDAVDTTLTGASVLAEACLEAALKRAEHDVARRHGVVRAADGSPQRLVVMGLGKLGGGELNFSSDVDLVFAFAEQGESDGARPLDADAYFARVAQQVVALLAERTSDGYVYRVDLRLRPFGNSGRTASSFAAMEQYYQREGRDWERYAWIKARPVAGDRVAGARLVEMLRPFVFRRYLDYSAFGGLREMKTLIDAEVARKDLAQHLKLGPGGIREIEFIVQLVQLIRGGREPALRVRGLLPALKACEQLGFMPAARAQRLADAYRFLRRLENRVQMFADQQTHSLPDDVDVAERIALALDFADVASLVRELDRHRAIVSEEFAALMAPVSRGARADGEGSHAQLWRQLVAGEPAATRLAEAGFDTPEEAANALEALLTTGAFRSLATPARARVDRLMPAIFDAARATAAPTATLARVVRLVQAVTRRAVYLSLLDEQPNALKRLVDIFAASAFLAERVAAHPLLLDELFDTRDDAAPPDRASVDREIARRLSALDGADPEAEIDVLQEERLSAMFRVGLALLGGRLDAVGAARALAGVAEAVLAATLKLAERDTMLAHGRLDGQIGEGSGLAVIGYGSLGGAELGFNSDLDLVFVYDGAQAQRESSGPRVVDGARYFARLAQRVVHLLTTPTRAGRLYEVDVRLRPDGAKGLLVTTLDGFLGYQTERAWTWEHQALVRARAVAGDVSLGRRFERARGDLLALPRDADKLRAEIVAMRARWRAERDRSTAALFDIKQGPGGLVDLEFLLQAMVLLESSRHRGLLASGNSADLIAAIYTAELIDDAQAVKLADAHAELLARALGCTLDLRPRVVARSEDLSAQAQAVRDVARSVGLDFESANAPAETTTQRR